MSLFDKIFGSKKEVHFNADSYFKMLNAYVPAFTTWGGRIYESELVRAAINAKAEHISKMSVRFAGAAQPNLRTKLKRAPNEFQTWSQFLYRLASILEIQTTAYIVPVIDEYDITTGITCILPQRCEFVEFNKRPYIRYTFGNGKVAAVELERVGIMTKFQYKQDLTGDGNDALKNTMSLIDITSQGITEGVKSAASYRFMAQYNNFTKAEDLAKERKRFTAENFSADAEGGGLLLFPNTYQNIKQLEAKPYVVDAEQMKLIQTNVFNYFGVNEEIMQNSADADALDAFYNGALEPFAVQLSEVLTKMLFTAKEQASGSKAIVASDRLQYMSVQNKINLINSLGDRGMITINEARELLNYPPVEGGEEMMPIRGEYYNATEKERDNGDTGSIEQKD